MSGTPCDVPVPKNVSFITQRYEKWGIIETLRHKKIGLINELDKFVAKSYIYKKPQMDNSIRGLGRCEASASLSLADYLFNFAHVSFRVTVRLNTRWSAVDSLSTLK